MKRVDINPQNWGAILRCPGCHQDFAFTVSDINYDGTYYGRCIECRSKIPIPHLPDSVKRLGSHGGFEEEDNNFGHDRLTPKPVYRPLYRHAHAYDDDDTGGH